MARRLKTLEVVHNCRLGPVALQGGVIVRHIQNGWLLLPAAFTFVIATAACDNTATGVRQDTAEATDEAKDTTSATKAEAQDQAAEARAEGREAANDASRTAANAGTAIDAAAETIDVKAALMADDTVDASNINVDTMHETKTVVLKGSVPTAAQKTAAGKIAAKEAEGYKVDNQLTVGAKR
jgi:osmotically-inducible protein OsmY